MTIAIDASTPAFAGTEGTASTSLTTNSFTPPAGSLVVLIYDSCASQGFLTPTISDSLGTHLNWTNKAAQISANGGVQIFIADVITSTAMTATASFTSSDFVSLIPVVVTGAKPVASQSGGTATNGNAFGNPTATIASLVGNNSLVIGGITNNSTGAQPAPTGQSRIINGNDTWDNADGCFDQYLTGMNLSAGSSATINIAAGGIEFGIAIAEILASTGSSVTGIASLSSTASLASDSSVVGSGPADEGSASLAATGTVAATGDVAESGIESLSATASILITAKVAHTGISSQSVTASLTAIGGLSPTGVVNLSTIASLSAIGDTQDHGIATLASTASVAATANVVHTGIATLSTTGSLTAQAADQEKALVSFSTTASANITAKVVHTGIVALSTTGAQATVGRVVYTGIVGMSSTAVLGAATTGNTIGQSNMSVTSSAVITGHVAATGISTLSTTGQVISNAMVSRSDISTLSATGSAVVAGVVRRGGQLIGAVHGAMTSTGVVGYTGQSLMSVIADMQISTDEPNIIDLPTFIPAQKILRIVTGQTLNYGFQYMVGTPDNAVPFDLSEYAGMWVITPTIGEPITYSTQSSTPGASGVFFGGAADDLANGIVNLIIVADDTDDIEWQIAQYKFSIASLDTIPVSTDLLTGGISVTAI